jgi:plasmid replication initiation protein
MALLKENRPDHDFFLADIFDNTPVKDDMASMEHPMFVLSKKKDLRCLEYRKDNVTITIAPSIFGLPNIFDKDILLYCCSLLMAEVNAGRIPPRTLRVSSHDLLVSTNRRTDGIAYARLKDALDRLKGVSIKTNIKTGKREQTSAFGLLESYDIIESSRVKDRMIRLEITLSEWFYNSIVGKEVLTINRDYFRLGKPMERRLYEIARKHCGHQKEWAIGLIPLMEKTGSTGTLRLFRSRLKSIARDDHIPDYAVSVADDDMVTFTNRNTSISIQAPLPLDDMPRISHPTLEKAQRIVLEARTGWDFYALQEQFTLSLQEGFKPDNVNGAFIAFVKKKVAFLPLQGHDSVS